MTNIPQGHLGHNFLTRSDGKDFASIVLRICGLLFAITIAAHFTGAVDGPVQIAFASGAAIFGAGFLLSWTAEVAQLKQLSAVSITFEMPTISESLDAVRGYKSRRERVPGTG